jgi:cyclopropane fatty-acyl-phospholipid synthase-like methyltransferase
MFDEILREYASSYYDFRSISNPDDPLKARFPAWVDYYRLKWSIARILKPRTILEIGVRYGYSGHAFLDACPDSYYQGIDLDSEISGGVKGAIEWAKKILQPFNADFLIADTQTMAAFPGQTYDLIHVDGQQDGDSSFHDLTLAIQQGHYILVDGYHWSNQNFLAVNDFLLQQRDRLDWYGAIPGYAGELLIKVKPQAQTTAQTSLDLRHTYDHTYYTQSCHGYDAFATHQGKRLLDDRLQAVATIACLKRTGRVLDLGCGRGELAYYFAQQGFEVTAIDYSQAAIDLAQQCFADEPELQRRVQFICADVNQVELDLGNYDLAIATDLIEHLAPSELSQLYPRIRQWLKPDGLLIIHTFPNRWYYQYDYARKRRQAKAIGAYLPKQPRSRYEQLMHINEQSPRVLQRQLSHAFEQVQVWFSGKGSNAVGGSLVKAFSLREMAAAPSLYAIATASGQAFNLLDLLQTRPLPVKRLPLQPGLKPGQIQLKILNAPPNAQVSSQFEIQVQLDNATAYTLHSQGDYPIHLTYRWLSASGQSIDAEGVRTSLTPPILPPSLLSDPSQPTKNHPPLLYSRQSYFVKINAPPVPGQYILRVTLVQEGVRWFDRPPVTCFQDSAIVLI